MINIGEYIEMAVEWLTEHGASFFDLLSLGVESVIDGILCVLLGIPFYITIRYSLSWRYTRVAGGQGSSPSWGCRSFTGWDSGRRPCRPWPWYSPPPAWR